MKIQPYFFPNGYKAPTPEEAEALHAQIEASLMREYVENGVIDVYGAIDVIAEEAEPMKLERIKENGKAEFIQD